MKKKELRKYKNLTTSELLPQFQQIKISIILVEPQGPINLGLTARAMKNFGFQNLILCFPQCEIDSEARRFSMHGLEILQASRILPVEPDSEDNGKLTRLDALFKEFDYVIGTSGKRIRFNNIKRITYYVDEINFSLISSPSANIALVFGREDTGLTNEELDLCDFVIKIPVQDDYPALNLSHAVAITLFSIYKKLREIKKGDVVVSSQKDREQLYITLENTLEYLDYATDARNKVIRAMKNIIGRSFTSLKEISLLLSLFASINKKKEEK